MDNQKIRDRFERCAAALRLRPGVGRKTALTRVRLRDGLHCEIEEGQWRFTAGLSKKAGGDGCGPDSGVLGRGALGSCLAIGYGMWAAKFGVELSELEVEIHADFDAAGFYGVADVPAGYLGVRYVVTVTSDASRDDILSVLDVAEAHSPYLDVFSREQDLRREVRISPATR